MTADPYEHHRDGLLKALKALGPNADAVAHTLLRRGFRGKRSSCGECPVALYILSLFGGRVAVEADVASVEDELLIEDESRYYHEPRFISCILPAPVSEFIAAYDADGYPELLKE